MYAKQSIDPSLRGRADASECSDSLRIGRFNADAPRPRRMRWSTHSRRIVPKNASVSWRAIHSAVGFVVTLIQTRPLRSSRTVMKAYKPMVGTTNRSIAAISGVRFRRKVRQPWLGGPRRFTMYLAMLD
jgi:hypothetical protein